MNTSPGRRRRRTAAQRERILKVYRQSQLSQREFAARAGIGLSTLGLWLRKACTETAARGRFVEVPNPLSVVPATAAMYRLHLGGGVMVEVSPGFRCEEVAALVQLFPAR